MTVASHTSPQRPGGLAPGMASEQAALDDVCTHLRQAAGCCRGYSNGMHEMRPQTAEVPR